MIGSLEDDCAERNVDYGAPDQEVSDGTRHHCDILTKNMAFFFLFFFCPCLKNLLGAKLKSYGLILLAEEISRQSNNDSVTWSLGITLMKIYSEKEQTGQRETKCTM